MTASTARFRRVPAALLLASVVSLTGCAGTDESEAGAQTSASPPASSAASTTPSATSAAPSTTPAPAGTNVAVSYMGGQVTGDTGRIQVASGDQVTITVTSDATDEIHLHGYDLSAPVGPDAPGTLTFQASIPGVFEVELEELGTLLFTLQVG